MFSLSQEKNMSYGYITFCNFCSLHYFYIRFLINGWWETKPAAIFLKEQNWTLGYCVWMPSEKNFNTNCKVLLTYWWSTGDQISFAASWLYSCVHTHRLVNGWLLHLAGVWEPQHNQVPCTKIITTRKLRIENQTEVKDLCVCLCVCVSNLTHCPAVADWPGDWWSLEGMETH